MSQFVRDLRTLASRPGASPPIPMQAVPVRQDVARGGCFPPRDHGRRRRVPASRPGALATQSFPTTAAAPAPFVNYPTVVVE
jgi:hypothetical protein